MEQKNKENNVTFSEKIDNTINGFALVITFITIGIFLLFNKNYFGNELIATIIQWTFIALGCLGFSTEISRMNKDRNIKGIDNVVLGIVLIIIWSVIYFLIKNWIGSSIGFLFLVFGIYGICRGIIEIGYSIMSKGQKEYRGNKLGIIKEIVIIISEIAGIALIIIQILQAVKVI